MSTSPAAQPRPAQQPARGARPASSGRAFWTKQFYVWHWVSSAFALAAMIFFAVTGITLNHAASLGAKPRVTQTQARLPAELLTQIAVEPAQAAAGKRALPPAVREWLGAQLGARPGGRKVEWQADEIYIDLPRPGGDGWLTIDRATGEIHQEVTTRGVVAWLNDLHKGRHTGTAWIVFMDFFSVVCVIFCLTGLALLVVHARRRPMTWPVVAAGLLLPVVIVIFFLHL